VCVCVCVCVRDAVSAGAYEFVTQRACVNYNIVVLVMWN
jgi:hypothetical protein